MDYGEWSPDKRSGYNKQDNWYRGEDQVYVKVPDPRGHNITEMVMPDNALYCGLLKDRQQYVSAECYFSFDILLDLQLKP